MKTMAIAGLLAGVLAAPGQALAAPPATLVAGDPSHYVPGEVLVKFKPTASLASRAAAVASHAHVTVAELPGEWAHVKVRPEQTVEDALAAYAADPSVETAQPNFVYRATAVPNDTFYGQLWAFKNSGQTIGSIVQPGGGGLYGANPGTSTDDINVEKAWGRITDCSAVVVAVVDTGVNYNHQDLASNMWTGNLNHGWDFVDSDNDPMDFAGHGTHVAGIIGAVGNNGVGTTGVCWTARIMAVRVLNALGSGTSSGIIQGINFAVTNGAQVINMSLGGGGPFDPAYSGAITAAQTAGVVVVVAAGNSNQNVETTPTYPCSFTQPNLICVAALDQAFGRASFSNYGATSVDVGAPGTNILSTWMGAVIADPLTGAGWNTSSTTGTSWAIGSDGVSNFLLDPSTYGGIAYTASTDDRAYKTFDTSGATGGAHLEFKAAVDVMFGDDFRATWKTTAADPFSGGGTNVVDVYGNTNQMPMGFDRDISGCVSATCTVGFQLQSGATLPKDTGIGVGYFKIKKLDAVSYNTIHGTSMASPVVAGLATMLRAYNPQYTAIDVVTAIEQSGRSIGSLAGITTTGKAIDAMLALAYLHPPTGLAATVH